MHVVQEVFHTLHLRQWEAARLHNEVSQLADDADIAITDYPALSAFLEAIGFAARVDDSPSVTHQITPPGTEDDDVEVPTGE